MGSGASSTKNKREQIKEKYGNPPEKSAGKPASSKKVAPSSKKDDPSKQPSIQAPADTTNPSQTQSSATAQSSQPASPFRGNLPSKGTSLRRTASKVQVLLPSEEKKDNNSKGKGSNNTPSPPMTPIPASPTTGAGILNSHTSFISRPAAPLSDGQLTFLDLASPSVSSPFDQVGEPTPPERSLANAKSKLFSTSWRQRTGTITTLSDGDEDDDDDDDDDSQRINSTSSCIPPPPSGKRPTQTPMTLPQGMALMNQNGAQTSPPANPQKPAMPNQTSQQQPQQQQQPARPIQGSQQKQQPPMRPQGSQQQPPAMPNQGAQVPPPSMTNQNTQQGPVSQPSFDAPSRNRKGRNRPHFNTSFSGPSGVAGPKLNLGNLAQIDI